MVKCKECKSLEALHGELIQLVEKYESLVWYGRSGCGLDKHDPELKTKVLNARARVAEHYPEDLEEYEREGWGDWKHGFNSGCLAAFRFARQVSDKDDWAMVCDEEGEETGEKYFLDVDERLELAKDIFPNLDT